MTKYHNPKKVGEVFDTKEEALRVIDEVVVPKPVQVPKAVVKPKTSKNDCLRYNPTSS